MANTKTTPLWDVSIKVQTNGKLCNVILCECVPANTEGQARVFGIQAAKLCVDDENWTGHTSYQVTSAANVCWGSGPVSVPALPKAAKAPNQQVAKVVPPKPYKCPIAALCSTQYEARYSGGHFFIDELKQEKSA